jgi:hypothetical protein
MTMTTRTTMAPTSSPTLLPQTDEDKNTSIDSKIVREGVRKEIPKRVLRQKLSKLRHLVLTKAIDPDYLDSIFPALLEFFDPQIVTYNGGIAKITEWKISCYLEVMDGGVPTANPNIPLAQVFAPLLDTCNSLFLEWYRQQHSCNRPSSKSNPKSCKRLMTFITRYTPAPGEQALLKVCRKRHVPRIPKKCYGTKWIDSHNIV